jgi:hypothetical protein
MSFNVLLDRQSFVNASTIPKDDDIPAKMPEKMLQERTDIQSIKIAGTHADIQSQALSFGRYGKSIDG